MQILQFTYPQTRNKKVHIYEHIPECASVIEHRVYLQVCTNCGIRDTKAPLATDGGHKKVPSSYAGIGLIPNNSWLQYRNYFYHVRIPS